jgi:hypothetical protein
VTAGTAKKVASKKIFRILIAVKMNVIMSHVACKVAFA